MDRIRKYANLVLQKYPNIFSTNYEENKKALDQVCEISSKQLRNEVAGYITKIVKSMQDKKQISEVASADSKIEA